MAGALLSWERFPNFARLAVDGSHTGAMLPVYPTLSLPNHFSLSTGCYPEHHGIVSNRFIDPELGLYAHDLGDTRWLLGCEPINVVADDSSPHRIVEVHDQAFGRATELGRNNPGQ